jgi:hypothetical protein
VKERPILFSAPMVRAILEGRKTQTRRIVKLPPAARDLLGGDVERAVIEYGGGKAPGYAGLGAYVADHEYRDEGSVFVPCPYGAPGDRLWVRETFTAERRENMPPDQRILVVYRASCEDGFFELVEPSGLLHSARVVRWKPSIFMPREWSRITLEVSGVRVERLCSISEVDAKAEGVAPDGVNDGEQHRSAFCALWHQINGAESWLANPWVWVVEFRRLEEKVQAA